MEDSRHVLAGECSSVSSNPEVHFLCSTPSPSSRLWPSSFCGAAAAASAPPTTMAFSSFNFRNCYTGACASPAAASANMAARTLKSLQTFPRIVEQDSQISTQSKRPISEKSRRRFQQLGS